MKLLLIRKSSKIKTIKMSDSKTVNVLKSEYIHLDKLQHKKIFSKIYNYKWNIQHD